MAVIKQARAREVMHHAGVFDLSDVKREAAQIIADARAEANALVEAAKKERERLTSGAAEEGYNRGLEQGLNEGRERGQREGFEQAVAENKTKLDALIAAWAEALERWDSERTCMYLEARRDVLEVALQLTRKIVHRFVEIDPEIVRDQIAGALQCVAKTTSLVVSVNPEDREVLERIMPSVLEQAGRSEHMTFRDDESLARGGCVVRTEGGRVDASIETQLRRLTESLLPGSAQSEPHSQPDEPKADDAS